MSTAIAPAPVFDHLLAMTDRRGTFEHACLDQPRPEHGYCSDDMARVLVVATREPDASGEVNGLAGVAVRFLGEAQALTGACRNRMDSTGKWLDEAALDDCWGRCLWGLGTAVAHSDVVWIRKMALVQFERAAFRRQIIAQHFAHDRVLNVRDLGDMLRLAPRHAIIEIENRRQAAQRDVDVFVD